MTLLFEPKQEKDVLMASDVEFAIAVAARALVRHQAVDPYKSVTTAVLDVKMGAWPKSFRALLVVGEPDAVSEFADGIRATLDLEQEVTAPGADPAKLPALKASLAAVLEALGRPQP
jgi:hypothetical protein